MSRYGILTMALLAVVSFATLPAAATERLKLATTTSTGNSGLLAVLNPPFEEKHGLKVDVIAVGTGKALALGRNGDADVLLVHARAAEEAFIGEGHGVNRRDVMYNDFIILGPAEDPAGIRGLDDAASALKAIAAKGAPFVSRGDDSGTHKKERALWKDAAVNPAGDWYMEIGQGMGAVLTMAGEKEAYVLADRGTWLAYKGKTSLGLLVEGDDRLFNPYGVMAVNPARWSHVNYEAALAYIAWLTSFEGQHIIREFTVGGEALFKPLAVTAE